MENFCRQFWCQCSTARMALADVHRHATCHDCAAGHSGREHSAPGRPQQMVDDRRVRSIRQLGSRFLALANRRQLTESNPKRILESSW
jgi:hypothetical protein